MKVKIYQAQENLEFSNCGFLGHFPFFILQERKTTLTTPSLVVFGRHEPVSNNQEQNRKIKFIDPVSSPNPSEYIAQYEANYPEMDIYIFPCIEFELNIKFSENDKLNLHKRYQSFAEELIKM